MSRRWHEQQIKRAREVAEFAAYEVLVARQELEIARLNLTHHEEILRMANLKVEQRELEAGS